MGVLEFLGISQSKDKSEKRLSGVNIGTIIIAVACVTLVSRTWVISTIVFAVGMLVFIISAVNLRRHKRPGSTSEN